MDRIHKFVHRHPFDIFFFISWKVDIWDDEIIYVTKRSRKIREKLPSTRVLMGLKYDEDFFIWVFLLDSPKCRTDLVWMMSVVRHDDISIFRRPNNLWPSPWSFVRLKLWKDDIILHSEKSAYSISKMGIMEKMLAWDLKFHLRNIESFFCGIDFFCTTAVLFYTREIYDFFISDDDFFLWMDIEPRWIRIVCRDDNKSRGLIHDRLECRDIVFETFIIVEMIEVDIGNHGDIRMILEKWSLILTCFDDEILCLDLGIEIGIPKLWYLRPDDCRASRGGRHVRERSIVKNLDSRIIFVFIGKHQSCHSSSRRLSMRARNRDPLLRIEYFPQCDGVREMRNPEISRFRKFRIGIYLLFWSEVRLRDDRFRVDDEIRIFDNIFGIMSYRDRESLFPKSFEKWRIRPIGTWDRVSEMFIVASQSWDSDPSDTDDVKMFYYIWHRSTI